MDNFDEITIKADTNVLDYRLQELKGLAYAHYCVSSIASERGIANDRLDEFAAFAIENRQQQIIEALETAAFGEYHTQENECEENEPDYKEYDKLFNIHHDYRELYQSVLNGATFEEVILEGRTIGLIDTSKPVILRNGTEYREVFNANGIVMFAADAIETTKPTNKPVQ